MTVELCEVPTEADCGHYVTAESAVQIVLKRPSEPNEAVPVMLECAECCRTTHHVFWHEGEIQLRVVCDDDVLAAIKWHSEEWFEFDLVTVAPHAAPRTGQ